MAAKFEISKGPTGKFRFNLKEANGTTIASNHGYETKAAAEDGIESVKDNASVAVVVDNTHSDTPSTDGCPWTNLSSRIDRMAFARMDHDGKKLIRQWLDLATGALIDRPDKPFEPFIYAWIAFNGWAAWCTKRDKDSAQVNAMASDASLHSYFEALLQENTDFRGSAKAFHDLWPIFNAAQLRRKGGLPASSNRHKLVNYYLALDDPPIDHAPDCYEYHIVTEGDCPLNWAHTVKATYQVRCNLFHGEKGSDSEMDMAIVGAAVKTLVPFLKQLLRQDQR